MPTVETSAGTSQDAQISQQLTTMQQSLDTLNQTLTTISTQVQAIQDDPAPPPVQDYSPTLDTISGNLQSVTQVMQDLQAQQEQMSEQPVQDYSEQNAQNVETVTYCALLVTAAVAISLGFAIFDRFLEAWKMRG